MENFKAAVGTKDTLLKVSTGAGSHLLKYEQMCVLLLLDFYWDITSLRSKDF